jgi:ribonuclease R
LIPIRTLGSEYFNYDETRHALVGSRSGAMHRLGDIVDVRLVEAAPVAGALRFELLSESNLPQRGRKPHLSRASGKADQRGGLRKQDRKEGKPKSGKSKKGKSWKR